MKNYLLASYRFNLRYANFLVVDLPDEWMTRTPARGLENHPAFTLGHLASGAAMTAKYLGGAYEFSQEWESLFKRNGPGDPTLPNPDTSKYPAKKELLKALTTQHQRVENLILDLCEQQFLEPAKWRFKQYFPTLGDLLFFMCITHESMHLGQLAAWRRALGLPSALGQL